MHLRPSATVSENPVPSGENKKRKQTPKEGKRKGRREDPQFLCSRLNLKSQEEAQRQREVAGTQGHPHPIQQSGQPASDCTPPCWTALQEKVNPYSKLKLTTPTVHPVTLVLPTAATQRLSQAGPWDTGDTFSATPGLSRLYPPEISPLAPACHGFRELHHELAIPERVLDGHRPYW